MNGKILPDTKKRSLHRLKIIDGKVRGLYKMIEDERYCIDILTQSLSIQESLKSFDALMLKNHFDTHVIGSLAKEKQKKMSEELLKIFKLANK